MKKPPSKTEVEASRPPAKPAPTPEPAKPNGTAHHTIGRLLAVMRSKGEDLPDQIRGRLRPDRHGRSQANEYGRGVTLLANDRHLGNRDGVVDRRQVSERLPVHD